MRLRQLLAAIVFGLALTLALWWLLGLGPVPVGRAAMTSVDTTNDGVAVDGVCTLREAIIAANTDSAVDTCPAGSGADLINLMPGTYVLTATGPAEDLALTGDLDITDTLSIVGAGPGQTIIDGNGIDRVFDIHAGAGVVSIYGVTVRSGNAMGGNGGGIRGDRAHTLVNTEVSSNTAANGGGVYGVSGRLTLVGGQVVSNTATDGGGVYLLSASLDCHGGSIIGYNNATSGSGGGVYLSGEQTWISDALIISNTAEADGGGMYVSAGSVSLFGGQIVSNTAKSGGGGIFVAGSAEMSGGAILGNVAGEGGGVYVDQSGAVFTQTGASIVGRNGASYGGGMYISEGSAKLIGGDVASNTAYTGGGLYVTQGGSVTVEGGRVVSNTAVWYGGGVYVDWGSASLSAGQILSNSANLGGGVNIHAGNATFTQTGTGGIVGNRANSGGGVYVNQGSAQLSGGHVINNMAGVNGGGAYNWDGALTLLNTTVGCNAAATGSGGGLYSYDGTTVMAYTTIASNTAASGGFGIHWFSTTVRLRNTIIAHNGTTSTNCNAGLDTKGHNLEYGDTCGLGAPADRPDTDPLLGALTNESSTLVYPLLAGSPAIDTGICLPQLTTVDQRGVSRPQGGGCDIGAYEVIPKVYLPLVLRSF